MTYEYDQIGEFTREYTVPISQEALDQRTYELTNEVASSAHLKGFRKGKAPRKVISQRYGSAIQNDVLEKIVNENCTAILSDEGLQAGWIGRPYLTKPTDAAYTYKVRVETMPQIEIGDLTSLTIKRPNVNLSEEEVRKQINNARERCIDWFELEGEGIESKEGDRVWIELCLASETSTDTEADSDSEDTADSTMERLPIVLRSPKNETSTLLHDKLVGKTLGDQLDILQEELVNEFSFDESAVPESQSVVVARIDTGDLPQLGPSLFGRPEFRHLVDSMSDDKLESIEDLLPIARSSIERAIEQTTEQVLQNRAMWALATQHVSTVPREVLRQRFLEAAQGGEQNIQTMFMALRLFDPIVDGETLDQSLLMANSHSHNHDHDHDHDHDAESGEVGSTSESNGEESLIPESLRTFWTNEVNRAIQRVVFTLTQQALIEQRDLEADQAWVASQIQVKADSVNLVEDQSRAQEYLDYVYGERHYQELITQNLLDQATKLLLEEASIEDEDVDFETFFSQPAGEEAEDALDTFKVAPSLPDPEGFVSATTDTSDETTNELPTPSDELESTTSSSESAEETTSSVSDEMTSDADEQNKPGIFKKLFKKNT